MNIDVLIIAAVSLLASLIGGLPAGRILYARAGKAMQKEADELRKVHAATLRILQDAGFKARVGAEGNFLGFDVIGQVQPDGEVRDPAEDADAVAHPNPSPEP